VLSKRREPRPSARARLLSVYAAGPGSGGRARSQVLESRLEDLAQPGAARRRPRIRQTRVCVVAR